MTDRNTSIESEAYFSDSSRWLLGRVTPPIAGILEAIRQLMAPPEPAKKRPIGFVQTD